MRFIVGDTNSDDQLLSDEEIGFLLAEHDSPLMAAHYGLVFAASKLARLVDTKTGALEADDSQKREALLAQAEAVKELMAEEDKPLALAGVPYSGTVGKDPRFWSDQFRSYFRAPPESPDSSTDYQLELRDEGDE